MYFLCNCLCQCLPCHNQLPFLLSSHPPYLILRPLPSSSPLVLCLPLISSSPSSLLPFLLPLSVLLTCSSTFLLFLTSLHMPHFHPSPQFHSPLSVYKWIHWELRGNVLLQYLAWVSYPMALIMFASFFCHLVAPQAIGVYPLTHSMLTAYFPHHPPPIMTCYPQSVIH